MHVNFQDHNTYLFCFILRNSSGGQELPDLDGRTVYHMYSTESDEESNMETSLKPVIHEDTDGSDKENYQISDSDNHNAEDVAMDTCSDNDHDTEEASAAESDDEETNTMTIVRTQPGDDGLLKAVKQNQVSFTGHEKQVRTKCDQVRLIIKYACPSITMTTTTNIGFHD